MLIKFHAQDILIREGDDDDEEFVTQGPVRMVKSLSIPRKDIDSNKIRVIADVGDTLFRLNVPTSMILEYTLDIYSKAVTTLAKSESRGGSSNSTIIRPILVNITFINFIEDGHTGAMTRCFNLLCFWKYF